MPVKARLTKKVVEALAAPQEGTRYYWDSELPGFAVRVRQGKGGVQRAYVVRLPKGKSGRWITIGKHGDPWRPDPRTGTPRRLTAELARDEALTYRGLWKSGQDPKAVRDAGRLAGEPAPRVACPTLAEFWRDYLTKHVAVHKAPRTAREDRGLFARHLEPWRGDARLDDIGPGDVAGLQAKLSGTPVTANRALSLLSHLFNTARTWRAIPRTIENPCLDVPRFKEKKQERFLSAEELGRLGPALAEERDAHPYSVAAILTLALTGARPVEILTLRREQLRLDLGHVMIQRKGHWRPLYLPPLATALLSALPPGKGEFVFPGKHGHLSMEAVSMVWRRARVKAGLADVRLYSLRHTLASIAINQGASLEHIGGWLGHSQPGTTARYAHLVEGPVRAAGEKAAAQIEAALTGKGE